MTARTCNDAEALDAFISAKCEIDAILARLKVSPRTISAQTRIRSTRGC